MMLLVFFCCIIEQKHFIRCAGKFRGANYFAPVNNVASAKHWCSNLNSSKLIAFHNMMVLVITMAISDTF